MRTIKMLSLGLLAAAFAAAPALAATPGPTGKVQCLNVRDIADTISKDGETITFRMTNGTTVVNHLKTKCDSLRFGGFSWVTAPGGEICGGNQMLRAQVTGEICRLGQFDAPVKMSAAR